jgi:hypothetical protein
MGKYSWQLAAGSKQQDGARRSWGETEKRREREAAWSIDPTTFGVG